MNEDRAARSVAERRGLLRLLGGGTVAGAAMMAPVRWSRPVIDSVILPAHAQTSAPTSSPPSPSPGPIAFTLTVDSVGADNVTSAQCSNEFPSGQNPVQIDFAVQGWTASIAPAPPAGTSLHVRGVILSVQGTADSKLFPLSTTCALIPGFCTTPFDDSGVAVETGSGFFVVRSEPGFDGPGAPPEVEYGLEFSVPSLPQVPVQNFSLGTVALSATCFD